MPLTKLLNPQTLDNTALIPIPMASIIVDTADQVLKLIECIESTIQKPLIFIDLEGVDLSRHGSIGIMQILVLPSPVVHLVDIFTLQQQAFDTSVSDKASLRTILESKDYPKVFFDVRNDSDALYSHFQISLQGVIDLQLLEYASRPRRGRFLKGLAKCVSEDGGLDFASSQEWQSIKNAGADLFAPEKGVRYEVFLERPLTTALQKYCAQDVLVMPKLLTVYGRRIPSHLGTQVNNETLARIILSQGSDYNGKGRHMAVGPNFAWNR